MLIEILYCCLSEQPRSGVFFNSKVVYVNHNIIYRKYRKNLKYQLSIIEKIKERERERMNEE
jgi:hypothetical protein